MKLKTIALITLLSVPATTPFLSRAQEARQEDAGREIKIGSHVLKQKGESAYSYDNDVYYYEKVWEVPGATKDEVYKRVKKWLKDPTGATVTDIIMDEDDKEYATAELELVLGNDLDGGAVKGQHVTCKFRFSFKDGKVRLQVSDFMYYADYDYGYSNSVSYNANGATTHSSRNAGEYKMKLHDLKPLRKKQMENIYNQFDEGYLVVIRAMKKAILSADNNW